jgi:hypothetical protein
MKKKATQRRAACFASIALMLAGGTANAALITIEPDDYAPGTDLSHIVPGLTLESLYQASSSGNTYNPVVTPLYAGIPCNGGGWTNCEVAATGDQMFASSPTSGGWEYLDAFYANDCISRGGSPAAGCVQGFSVVSAHFEGGTSFVSFDAIWKSDPLWIYAYNSAGQLVASCFGPNEPTNPSCYTAGGFHPDNQNWLTGTMSVASAAGDIAWVIAGGDNGGSGVDRLVFESPASVPEPATLGMLLAGVAGGFIAKRKKRAS